METQKQTTEAPKRLRVYNLIVLDESGSMEGAWNATISGCNETINVARSADNDKLEQMVSIYAFQDGCAPSRYLVKNVPAGSCEHITKRDYEPGGCTPLYDAVGSTIVDLMATVKAHPGSVGAVTIITDGYENASTHYSLKDVANLIDQAKEMGWSVTFIGANIDAAQVGATLHVDVDATLQFDNDEEGTEAMFAKTHKSRLSHYHRMAEACEAAGEDADLRVANLKKANKNYFKGK